MQRQLTIFPLTFPPRRSKKHSRWFSKSRSDVPIAFGGGSVIDAAKGLATDVGRHRRRVPPIVALPTTLFGAEFAHVYGVLTETDQGPFKRSRADPTVAPEIIFLDSELTQSTPETLWLSSGIKALDHAIEGLLSAAERPINDTIALAGIARMVVSLPRSLSLGLGARLEAQFAAWMCYFAPATIRVGLRHRIGYILGANFQVRHSLTSCVTLASVMRAFATLEPQKLARIASALSIPEPDPKAASFIIDRLVRNLGLPRCLRDLGLDAEVTPRIARLVRNFFPRIARGSMPSAVRPSMIYSFAVVRSSL
jgi:alcohol dehydrogenase class IV